ncbi:MAG: hypothetical protein K0S14_905, partial [Thermomicrobiales bacterium]|nr:hypothetical protein [Thermomicrobiales bacterium]
MGNGLRKIRHGTYDFPEADGVVCRMAFMATAIIEPTSETLAGRI